MLVFVVGLSAPVQADPGLEVVPPEHNFGEVELGSSSSTIITIENNEFSLYYIDNVGLDSDGSADFSILSAPAPGTELLPGESTEVVVSFTPSDVGYVSATLQITWANADTGVTDVLLEGVGIAATGEPVSIQDILDFFDQSVADGSLVGSGPGKSADARKKALRNMIAAAGHLIEDGYFEEACPQLMDAYQRTDGLDIPPDFVEKPAAPTLAQMILDLIGELGCD